MSLKYGRYFLASEADDELPPEDIPPVDAGEDIPPEETDVPPMENDEEEELTIPDSREEEYIDDSGVPHNLKIIDIKPRNYHFFDIPEDAPDEEMMDPMTDTDGGQSLLNPDGTPIEEPMGDIEYDADGNPIEPSPEDSELPPEGEEPPMDNVGEEEPQYDADGNPIEPDQEEPPIDDEALTANPNGMENPPEEPPVPQPIEQEPPMDNSTPEYQDPATAQQPMPTDQNMEQPPVDQPAEPPMDPTMGQPTDTPPTDPSMGGMDPMTNPDEVPPTTNPDGTPMMNPDGTPMAEPTGDLSVDNGPMLDDMSTDFSPDADPNAGGEGDMPVDGEAPPEGDTAQAAPTGPGLEYDSTRKYTLFKNFMSLSNAIDNYISKMELKMGDDANRTAILKTATDKLREINDLCYDYITMKFEISSYVQSLLFFQKLIVMIQLVFEMVSDGNKTLKKQETQKKQ